jgi:phage baseplate assembly protein W
MLQRQPMGDWARADPLTARRQNLTRRLITPRGSLWYDRAFGNRAFELLSQPATSAWVDAVVGECRQVAQQEPGVQVTDVTVSRQDRLISVTVTVRWDGITADAITVTM